MKSRIGRRIIGGVCYITHIFDHIGDELGVHNHESRPEHLHVTVLTKGSFALLGTRAGQVAHAGDFITWGTAEDHGLAALTDGAQAVNIRAALPDERDL